MDSSEFLNKLHDLSVHQGTEDTGGAPPDGSGDETLSVRHRGRVRHLCESPLGVPHVSAGSGRATESDADDREAFHFLVREDICTATTAAKRALSGSGWTDQGIEEYEAMGASFRDLMLAASGKRGSPDARKRWTCTSCPATTWTASAGLFSRPGSCRCSTSTKREWRRSATDDTELLEFAMQWLRFSLFGEKTMRTRRKPDEPRRAAAPAASAEVAP